MNVRTDIAELLHAGLTNAAIAARCNTNERTVAALRKALGIPPCKPGRRPQASIEDAFHAHTRPAGNGHLDWNGPYDKNTPVVSLHRDYRPARRVAFLMEHGRAPVGQVRPACDREGCVAPQHMADRPMREANRRADAAFAAIFGEAA